MQLQQIAHKQAMRARVIFVHVANFQIAEGSRFSQIYSLNWLVDDFLHHGEHFHLLDFSAMVR